MAHWQDTGVVEFSRGRQHSGERGTDIDGIDPRSTFIRGDAPPFPSHPRGTAVAANGCKQKCGNECDAKGVKRSHPGTRLQNAKAEVQPSHRQCSFVE